MRGNSKKAAYCRQDQRNMGRVLKFFLFLVWIGPIKASFDPPKLPAFPDTKRSYLAWPANAPLSLKCEAEGAQPLRVRWYQNGTPLSNSDAIVQDSQGNLRFRKPQISDSGIYMCVVSNVFGKAKHDYSLRVIKRIQSAPVLVPGYPKPQTARVGDGVTLECLEKQGGTVSDYRWLKWKSSPPTNPDFKNGKFVLLDPSKYESFITEMEDRKLHGVRLNLENVSENDRGFYTCFVSNNLGFSHNTAYLNVTPVSLTDPPEFIIPEQKRQQLVLGKEGRNVKMSCVARGGPPLKFQWLFEGQAIRSDERHEIVNGEMVLKNVRDSDQGKYTCSIRNDFGNILHNFQLHVLSRQRSTLPVLLPGYPKNKTAVVGHTVSLFCAEIENDGVTDFRWLKWHKWRTSFTAEDLMNKSLYSDVNPKHYGMRSSFFSSGKKGVLLTLKNVTMEDQGLYTCIASNKVGYSYKSAFLFITYPVKIYQHYDLETTEETIEEINYRLAALSAMKSPKTLRCYDYRGKLDKSGIIDNGNQCKGKGPCATIYNEKTDYWKVFCDNEELCRQNGISEGGCDNTTLKGDEKLCCCVDELCNKPIILEPNEKSSRPQFMTLVFLSALVLTFAVMLALLAYKIRQRKIALKGSILHKVMPSHKLTKQMIMETKWLKEGI